MSINKIWRQSVITQRGGRQLTGDYIGWRSWKEWTYDVLMSGL